MSNGLLENLNKQLIALNGNLEIFNSIIRIERNADPKTGVPNELKDGGSVIDVSEDEEELIPTKQSIPTLDGEPIVDEKELAVIAGKNTWLLMQDGSPFYVAKGDEMPEEVDIEKRITKKQYDELMLAASEGFANQDEGESFDDDEPEAKASDDFDDDDFGDDEPEDNAIPFDKFNEIMKLFGGNGNGPRAVKVLTKASTTGSSKLSSFADDPEGRTAAIEALKAKWKAYPKAAKKVGYEG